MVERNSTQGPTHQYLISIILNGLKSRSPNTGGVNITGTEGSKGTHQASTMPGRSAEILFLRVKKEEERKKTQKTHKKTQHTVNHLSGLRIQ